jgi:hypothetical protein
MEYLIYAYLQKGEDDEGPRRKGLQERRTGTYLQSRFPSDLDLSSPRPSGAPERGDVDLTPPTG